MIDRLDASIRSAPLPVRPETLAAAWSLTEEEPRSRRLTILVTLRARPGMDEELERATVDFVEATLRLRGAFASTWHRSEVDPLTFVLVERFADREEFERHMSADYFRRFQVVQAPLLAAPAEAIFLERPGT